MTALQPEARWKNTYPATAEAFATVASESPLFEGDHKIARTIALFLSISYYESRFRNDARGGGGRWLCLMQVAREHLPKGGAQKVLHDPEACVRAALPMLKHSFKRCASRPEEERLGLYVSSSCDKGTASSRGRMNLASYLIRRYRANLPDESAPTVEHSL